MKDASSSMPGEACLVKHAGFMQASCRSRQAGLVKHARLSMHVSSSMLSHLLLSSAQLCSWHSQRLASPLSEVLTVLGTGAS